MTPEELKRLRARLGLTQARLAERLGVTQNTVARWETKQRRIPEPVARLLAHVGKEGRRKRRKR